MARGDGRGGAKSTTGRASPANLASFRREGAEPPRRRAARAEGNTVLNVTPTALPVRLFAPPASSSRNPRPGPPRMLPNQVPSAGEKLLDHIAHWVPDLGAASGTLESLGFILTPWSEQHASPRPGAPITPVGSANRCIMLRSGYLEILAPLSLTPIGRELQGPESTDMSASTCSPSGRPIQRRSRPASKPGDFRSARWWRCDARWRPRRERPPRFASRSAGPSSARWPRVGFSS